MNTYTARELPPVGVLVATTTGNHYLVDEALPEHREHGDSARGFIMGRRVIDGVVTSTRRTRVYGAEIVREGAKPDPRPLLDAPEGYDPLPAHEIDPDTGVCRHCAAPEHGESYDDYLDHWYTHEYEGDPSHHPTRPELFDFLATSCLGRYRTAEERPAIEVVFDAVIDNYPIGRDSSYVDLRERTGLDSTEVAYAIEALVRLERVVERADMGRLSVAISRA